MHSSIIDNKSIYMFNIGECTDVIRFYSSVSVTMYLNITSIG